jgi:hypothetical protein
MQGSIGTPTLRASYTHTHEQLIITSQYALGAITCTSIAVFIRVLPSQQQPCLISALFAPGPQVSGSALR